MFYINVPVCLVIVLLAMKHLPKDGSPDREKGPTPLGGFSALVLIASLLGFLQDYEDPHLSNMARVVCSILAVASLAFLCYSIRRDSRRAVIAPQMLNREYILVGASFLLCTIVVAGAQYLLPYLLQNFYGLDTATSGLYLATMSVSMMIMVLPVGKMCDRFGCRTPVALAVITRSAFCALTLFLTLETNEPLLMIPALVIFGVSHAFSGTAQPTRMIHHATPGYEDESTNFMLVVNYVASALGSVVFAIIFSMFAPGSASDIGGDEFLAGFLPTMWFSLIILALAMVCTLSVKNKIVRKDGEQV
jgi:Na+/melibiose symporter-like transporter